jgi:hypothetical protein
MEGAFEAILQRTQQKQTTSADTIIQAPIVHVNTLPDTTSDNNEPQIIPVSVEKVWKCYIRLQNDTLLDYDSNSSAHF